MAIISKELMKYSLKGIIHRKTRSSLTIASMLIGITAIFILISFGVGLYLYVDNFSSESSANKLTIMPKGFGGMGFDEDPFFTEDDLKAIQRASGVESTSVINYGAAEIIQGRVKKYSFLIAYDPSEPFIMGEVSGIKLQEGRMLKSGDNNKIVLGYNYMIKDKVMPKAYELNDKIDVQGRDLTIIGFFEAVGTPQDDSQLYVTTDLFEELYPDRGEGYNWIFAEVDASKLDEVIKNVEDNLRDSRNLDKGKEDFFVQSFDDLLATYSKVLDGIVGFVILIALISILVSAINTSNTMITSVLERINEIGVMKSIGARNSEIMKIFLFESGVLGFVAGVLGVILGFVITEILGGIILASGWGFISPAYPASLFIGCILFATLTGALSGLAPAIQASRISPVKALRYE